ncbi:hypothetical protein DYBT9623_05486 [Dyadobacter sp. CECT 9623]|uniref:Response regulatory domain-containing protein n=1 Tax=Dyadobacter linearis TaxID=2823330 RepID=A0ABN7RL61_9BACT|nr:response regulator [Dyadobacter sp. CECT 9623]CAG5074798.1 hypothetical protein DYBT9623_05486 [Dyadobacter sp. CECT 9623]
MAGYANILSESQRFIIVDDDSVNNLVSTFIIQRHQKDAEIHVFVDPELALNSIQEIIDTNHNVKTIILLDINMPIMNGWEFLEELAKLKESAMSGFRIFMLSSSMDLIDKAKVESHTLVSGFFSKPLSLNHLSTACGNATFTD